MLVKKVLVLTVADVRLALAMNVAEIYRSNNLEDTADDLINGRIWNFSPKGMKDKDVIDLYAEWELGAKLAKEHGAEQVVVETHAGEMPEWTNWKYEVLYDTAQERPTTNAVKASETSTEVH